MKKRVFAMVLSIALVMTGCGGAHTAGNGADETASQDATRTEETGDSSDDSNGGAGSGQPDKPVSSLISGAEETIYYDPDLVPSVPEYKVAADFSNVTYHKNFAYLFESEYDNDYNDTSLLRNALIEKGFAVRNDNSSEFFDVYEGNRYSMFPNFVTVDSLMHTYHLYFAYLLRSIEKESLADRLKTVSTEMLARSTAQYQSLKGTDFEEAALRNVAFFYVGARLQDPSATEEAKAKDTELAKQLNEKGKKQETDMAQFKANGLRTLDSEKSRLRAKIISEISEVVSKRAQSEGYTLVLNTAYNEDDPKRPIIFTSGKNDITQEVLDILNADADKKTE